MRFDVVTLFPEMLGPLLAQGVVGRAVQAGLIEVGLHDLRPHGHGRHRNVDDTPYGGGAGMVLRVDCLVACLEAVEAEAGRGHRVLLSPQGRRLNQQRVRGLAARPSLTLVCGRYEGFDERVRTYVDEELSLGDFVLSGGEVAAMAVIDACSRLVPGVLGNADSLAEESHSPDRGGRLEYPHYTRPATFRGSEVPAVLLSGNHAAIDAWRRAQAEARTVARREETSS